MDLEFTSKKLLPRLGRRNTQHAVVQDDSKSDDDLDSPISTATGRSVTSQPPAVPPRSRKTGWGDDLKSAKSKSTTSMIERERQAATEKDNNDGDDIPVIPDLDEMQEDILLSDITKVPVHNVNRVTAYKELDTDLVKKAAFTSVNGVDLSFLAKKLYPEELVKEPDEVWNWNALFTQITSEMNSETEENSCK